MRELHLIGTLTQDPDGPERLAGLLREVRPDALAVEASRRVYERQRERGGAAREEALAVLRQRGADAATVDFWERRLDPARLHFEPFTAAAYAAADGLRLHFLGDDEDDEDQVGGAPPADGEGEEGGAEDFRRADPEALAALAGHDWAATYRADYARARADLEAKACLEFLIPVEAQPAYKARDEVICGRLRALLDGELDGAGGPPGRSAGGTRRGGRNGRAGPERLAVVCALTHLYFSEARLTIYSQLYEATTRRYVVDGKGAVRDHPIVLPWKLPAS